MKHFILLLIFILRITISKEEAILNISDDTVYGIQNENTELYLTPMEALDLVKERYADNFDKIWDESKDKYYYKLSCADLYLAYEEDVGPDHDYLIHLYEFVIDEPETGMGHAVTYGWYTVDRKTGQITEKTD